MVEKGDYADLVASVSLLSLPFFVGSAVFGLFGASLAPVTVPWFTLYGFVVIMGGTRLYGKGVVSAARESAGGLLEAHARNKMEKQSKKE